MSAEQVSPELTLRDVLSQVARRIDLVETDVRKLDSKLDARFDAQSTKIDTRFDAQSTRFDARFDTQDAKIVALGEKMDTRFRHLTTTIVAATGVLVAAVGACAAYLTVLRDLPA
jgi:hypothetical protein